MKYRAIKKSDFNFKFTGNGHYEVTYYSPKTTKKWSITITDMQIIDFTKNEDNPKQKDLRHLKEICKK
tara:strand:- start:393 stop:596 length:204 start_codon:yes stop_codon:yes gene_type:complete